MNLTDVKTGPKKLPVVLLYAYLGFIFTNSFTKISVPAFGLLELTFSDLLVILCSGVFLLMNSKIDKTLSRYIYSFLIFILFVGISIIEVKNYFYYITDFVPYIFGSLIVYSTIIVFSNFDKKKLLIKIRFVLLAALSLSTLPVYYQLITGVKLLTYYDRHGWRYTFLAQNPNQYGVTLLLYFIIISLITLKFNKKDLYKLLFFMAYFIPVVLFTGSKATALIFGLNLIFIALVSMIRSSLVTKVIVLPILIFLISLKLSTVIIKLKQSGGQVNRALSIFESLEDKGLEGVEVKGASGLSMDEAIRIFFENPIFGVGLANKPLHSNIGTEIHNTYLKTLAEAGIIGFFGFSLIFGLPMIAIVFSRTSLSNMLFFLIFYMLFAALNWPYMLLRQRWVWLFMIVCFIIARLDDQGKFEKSKLAILN